MTPCEKLGYKVGDRFVVKSNSTQFLKGQVIELIEDDGSTTPWFSNRGCEPRFLHLQKVKKLESTKETTMNNSLEQNIERMKKELADMEAKLKASQKWEPKGGDWDVDWRGRVIRSTGAKDNNTFGIMFQTQRQAEIASKLMRERNRIIQYVLQHEPNWKFGFKFGENNYAVEQEDSGEWVVEHYMWTKPTTIFVPSWVAPHLANDLNSGRVVL